MDRWKASPKNTVMPSDDYRLADMADINTPEKLLIQKELRGMVLEFMRTLPDRQRLVFNLRFYRNLPFAEISAITGNAEGTVKTNYREAVRKLREYMNQKGWQS